MKHKIPLNSNNFLKLFSDKNDEIKLVFLVFFSNIFFLKLVTHHLHVGYQK